MTTFSKYIWAVCLFLLATASGYGQQTITISWPSKQLLSPPLTIDQSTAVNIIVSNVNDILYTYEGFVTSTPVTPPNPLTAYLPPGLAAGATDPCADPDKKLKEISRAWDSWQLNPFASQGGKPVPASVSLATTVDFYRENIQQPLASISLGACADSTVQANLKALNDKNAAWLVKIGSQHTFTLSNQVLEPLNNYTIHLNEYASDSTHAPTLTTACADSNGKASECLIQYQPSTNLVSVSGGFLFSELPARTYSRQNVPDSPDAVLAVSGNSMSSLLTALVNVKIPCLGLTCSAKPNGYGFAISVGPVYQLNGTDVSKLGLFAGVSLDLYKYFYISAGTHVGQFADYPAGLTHPGQTIPASFTGPVTPISRTSARFAVGLTFKGFTIPTGNKRSEGQLKTPNGTK